MNRATRLLSIFSAVSVVVLTIGIARADGVRVFAPNSPAIAADVNHNFNVVAPTGTIVAYAGTGANPPDGWLFCDGSAFTGQPALSAALGSNFVPDLRGRVIVGIDPTSQRALGGIADTLGEVGGASANTQVPLHNHSISPGGEHRHTIRAACNGAGCGGINDGFARASSNIDPNPNNFNTGDIGNHDHGGGTGQTGLAGGVTNMQPFITLRYIVKT